MIPFSPSSEARRHENKRKKTWQEGMARSGGGGCFSSSGETCVPCHAALTLTSPDTQAPASSLFTFAFFAACYWSLAQDSSAGESDVH